MKDRNIGTPAGCPGSQRHLANTERPAFGRSFFPAHCVGHILALGAVLLLATACEEEPEVVEEIRSIKTTTVGEIVTGQVRKFSGIVRAVDRSALSFEVAGHVLSVDVDIGANVEEGQVLATLDEEPFELEVEKAEAELVTAEAKVKKEQAEYDRQKSLFEQGASAQKRVEQAEFALKEAKATVEFTESALDLVRRELRKTVLYAPFDGTIGVRQVEPFVNVRSGQKLFEIDAEGEQEIVVDIPETIVSLLTIDMPAAVSFPTLPGKTTKAKVTEVGTLAGEGNAFPVNVKLLDPPSDVRSGMTAEVTFELNDESLAAGHLVPVQALLPTAEANKGHVFVYQDNTSTVKKAPVRFRGVKDNLLIVSEGVAPGDIVAVAGVSFLSDGMKVKLMPAAEETKPETLSIQ